MLRRWLPVAVGGIAAATIGLGVYWLKTQSTPSASRPLVSQLDMRSPAYLARHAQSNLACPAGSTNCLVCNMQDAAGNLACQDHVGGAVSLVANGSPVYQLHTPIVKSGGFTHRAVGFEGTTTYFAAADAAPGDQTTNDFSVSLWVCPRANAVSDRVVSKRQTAPADAGWEVYFDAADATRLAVLIADAGGATSGAITAAGTFPNGVCKFVTVVFDRDGLATAYVNGAASGVTLNIAPRAGTIVSTSSLTVGRYAAAASNYFDGSLAGVLVHNGLVTLAQHQALYRALAVPSSGPGLVGTVGYTQTSNGWKWRLPDEPGFGYRLAPSGAGQWPVAYSPVLVTSTNPLGLGFPKHGAVTNVIGYPNEFNSWTINGAVVSTNAAEAPDGSVTAERVTYSANTQYIMKSVVGGGNVGAGERWCTSVFAKRVSGTCVGINLRVSSAGGSTNLTDATTWSLVTKCSDASDAGGAKRTLLYATTHGNCVLDVADAQYTQTDLANGYCTNCTGDANCVCNASYYTLTGTARASYLPNPIERLEVVSLVAARPWVQAANANRTVWQLGQFGELTHGVQPTLVLRNQGRTGEFVAKAKPLQLNEERREYTASIDLRNGLTNTTPRRLGGLKLKINGAVRSTYQHAVLDARGIATVDAPNQRDLNALVLSAGCDLTGANCSNSPIALAEVWARPAQEVTSAASDEAYLADFTGPAWLQSATVPDLCSYTFGVSSANRWCWNLAELSGDVYDQWNQQKLTASGTINMQQPSGLLVRGQGRRSMNFVTASSERFTAPNNSVLNLQSYDAATISVTFSPQNVASVTSQMLLGGSLTGADSGWALYTSNNGLYCRTYKDAANTQVRYHTTILTGSNDQVRQATCVLNKTGGIWAASKVFLDGVLLTTTNLVNGVVDDIANDVPVGAGGTNGGFYLQGQLYEGIVHASALSDDDILSRYKALAQTGRYQSSVGSLAHYKFNEATAVNGVGLRDHSGNGNHLTVMNGTPDPSWRDMLWPAGTGVVKPSAHYGALAKHYLASPNSLGTPSSTGSISACSLARHWKSVSYPVFPHKGSGTDYWRVYFHNTNGVPYMSWYVGGVLASTANGPTDFRDGRWHLICGKIVNTAPNTWRVGISVDGGAWILGVPAAGAPDAYTDEYRIGAPGVDGMQLAGHVLYKDYALTDADVAQLWTWTRGPLQAQHTYARTSTLNRGLCYDTRAGPIWGQRTTCFANNQVPFGYDSRLTGLAGNAMLGLGFPIHAAVQNLSTNSEALNSWTPTELTVATDDNFGADGAKTAERATETAVANYHTLVSNALATVAQGSTITVSAYLRNGGGSPVVKLLVQETAGGQYAYYNINLSTGAGGTCNVNGASWTSAVCSAYGVANGWIRVHLTATCNRVGGCPSQIVLCSGTVDGQCSSYGGSTSRYWWAWGAQAKLGAATPVYCPTDTATQTCNAPTSNYVPSANLASWTRSQGVVAATGTWGGAYSATLWDLALASANGRYYAAFAGGAGEDIWNGTGTLQQDIRNAAGLPIPAAGLAGMVQMFDSQQAFYGTRRAATQGYHANYSGLWTNYVVDTGANWTNVTNTNLHLGTNYTYSAFIDEYLGTIYIYNTR